MCSSELNLIFTTSLSEGQKCKDDQEVVSCQVDLKTNEFPAEICRLSKHTHTHEVEAHSEKTVSEWRVLTDLIY